eukprot:762534-Hanusia_phi.AAC.1
MSHLRHDSFALLFCSICLLGSLHRASSQLIVVDPPTISSLTASQPDSGVSGDSIFANGDKIIIQFDKDTDRGGFTSSTIPKASVLALFTFSVPLGADYEGVWQSASKFVITILDWPGSDRSGPPEVGEPSGLIVTCRTDGGRAIRVASPALSVACTSSSPKMLGDFGPTVVSCVSLTARGNPAGLGDSIYGNGVALIAKFNRETNLAGSSGVGSVMKMDRIAPFLSTSSSLGRNYTAKFTDRLTLEINVVDATGGFAEVEIFTLRFIADQRFGVRNFPAACAPLSGTSPPLSGNFGPSNVYILVSPPSPKPSQPLLIFHPSFHLFHVPPPSVPIERFPGSRCSLQIQTTLT